MAKNGHFQPFGNVGSAACRAGSVGRARAPLPKGAGFEPGSVISFCFFFIIIFYAFKLINNTTNIH